MMFRSIFLLLFLSLTLSACNMERPHEMGLLTSNMADETKSVQDSAFIALGLFSDQDTNSLALDQNGHIEVPRMGSFDSKISHVFWRPCYSYILCSTIALKERFIAGSTGRPQEARCTGVQGTGKSVLGALIALLFAKVF